jgi:hypothetical protein
MNNTPETTNNILALAAYVEGQRDGFKTGIVVGIGVVVVARMIARHRVRKAERTKLVFGRN